MNHLWNELRLVEEFERCGAEMCPGDSALCGEVQGAFSEYLDGAVKGTTMRLISAHLEHCAACGTEFVAWRTVQEALARVGPAPAPLGMQERLRAAAVEERVRGSHLQWTGRLALAWERTLAPLTLRVCGGLAIAVLLVGGLGWLFAAPLAVQANDDGLAHLVGPKYLYSQVPPQSLAMGRDVPIIVEAKVDESGRVYDYAILEGPKDGTIRTNLEQNLLASVFKPATLFGVPVRGHVLLTYAGVSVHG